MRRLRRHRCKCGRQPWLVALLVIGLALGCQSDRSLPTTELGQELDEGTDRSSNTDDWLPIVDEEPLPEGDVRKLDNCAEYPFEPVPRGPWEAYQNQELADDAPPGHQTTDRVINVGDHITVNAQMRYDDEPLGGEWVRLFFGSCDGWSMEEVDKTDDDGMVSFRLRERRSVGVYSAVFQAVGDATTTRAQVWVLPESTEVVAVQLVGGAYDGGGEVVEGAAELTRWHTRRGHLVVYVDNDDEYEEPLGERREQLRKDGFSVGPVLEVHRGDDGVSAEPSSSHRGWGEAGRHNGAGPIIDVAISTLYTGDADGAAALRARGIEADDEMYLDELRPTEVAGEVESWRPVIDSSDD